ncbi:DUF2712 domain-containing protein [Peribacillus frigoritolerans]|uniref:DUF2712 domain-containing protein n=1 Tax=Peribacillus frigoritolerans TaxID=450367 RepID=UPI00345CD191
MKLKLKKPQKLMLAGFAGVSILASANLSFAYENNEIGFDFNLKPNYGNTYTAIRERSTTNDDNQWKVNLLDNSEGPGTYATFWLEAVVDDWLRASAPHDVQEGSGNHYYTTNNNLADNTNTRMGAENNNYSTDYFNVEGYWDEETGVIQN